MDQLIEELKNNDPQSLYQGDDGKPELTMSELLAGMVNRDFFFHHQPIIDMVSGVQVGSEMLIRWVRRSEVLAPMWFMPMIERHNLITQLDRYVIDRYTEIPWSCTVKPDFKYRVFINISAQSFIDPEFIRAVSQAAHRMQENSVIPVLELSERTGCEIGVVKKHMVNLSDHGIELALDDFGIGHSSLARLIELPINILKIDRAIINMIGKSYRAETIIQSIFQIAPDLDIKIIAEGVETEMQSSWLASLGSCWAQGFYYARPSLAGYLPDQQDKAANTNQDNREEK